MSAQFKTDWSALTGEERQLLPLHRDKWTKATFSTAGADRERAEAAIEGIYSAAGLAEPEAIVWCASPSHIERERKVVRGRARGIAVKSQVVDQIISTCVNGILRSIPSRILQEVEQTLALAPGVARTINLVADVVDQAAIRHRWGWAAWAANTVARGEKLASFRLSRWLPGESAAILTSTSFLRELGLADAAPLAGLHALAFSAGGIVPHKQICWATDRPDIWRCDAAGRLHCADGPALRYRDGMAFHAWKGAIVPRHLIDNRDSIDRYDVDRERDPILRRCMIDIMTPERYIAAGGATRVSTDKAGVLWRRVWHGWDVWTAVEVVNGTPEPDGSYKHYYWQVPSDVHSALDAVAWTYGISSIRYLSLLRRT